MHVNTALTHWHADGMDWNRKAGTWIGTETAEQTITFTLA